jgi:hypothetical protein
MRFFTGKAKSVTIAAERVGLVVALALLLAPAIGVQTASAMSLSENPFSEQAGPLSSGELPEFAEQGDSVALSADGNTALVGAPFYGVSGGHKGGGAVFVYVRTGSTWSLQQKIVPKELREDAQVGAGVSLSADGNTALIGAPEYAGEGTSETYFGAAYVFTRSGTTWSEQQKLVGAGEHSTEKARQGTAVALSADGKTALIGAEDNETGIGGAFVFTLGTKWEQQGKILIGKHGTEIPLEGHSVALSGDGNTALIGGPKDEGLSKHKEEGSAWVFVRSGSTWSEQTQLPAGTKAGEEDAAGQAVALSADGNTALVGGPGYEHSNGAAWVYTRNGSTWSEQGEPLKGTDISSGPLFGDAVSLSEDGNTALIGGPADNVSFGAAWAFLRSGSEWAEPEKLEGKGATEPPEEGWAVSLSGDGLTALVGAPAYEAKGAVWVYARKPEKETEKETEKEKETITQNPNNGGGSNTPTGTGQNASTGAGSSSTGSSPSSSSGKQSEPSAHSTAQLEAALATAFGLPSAEACYSRRSFKIHIHQPHGYPKIVSAEVFLGGHRERSLNKKGLTDEVVLTKLPFGTFTIRIVARTAGGNTLTGTRTYHTCRSKPLKGHRHKL